MDDYRVITMSRAHFEPNAVDATTGGSTRPVDSYGEVAWLHKRAPTVESRLLRSGLWRTGPCVFDFIFPGDETLLVIEGGVTIELETGQVVVLEVGDLAWFPKGLKSTWHVETSLTEFFTVFDS